MSSRPAEDRACALLRNRRVTLRAGPAAAPPAPSTLERRPVALRHPLAQVLQQGMERQCPPCRAASGSRGSRLLLGGSCRAPAPGRHRLNADDGRTIRRRRIIGKRPAGSAGGPRRCNPRGSRSQLVTDASRFCCRKDQRCLIALIVGFDAGERASAPARSPRTNCRRASPRLVSMAGDIELILGARHRHIELAPILGLLRIASREVLVARSSRPHASPCWRHERTAAVPAVI